jgi:hypothetical protein
MVTSINDQPRELYYTTERFLARFFRRKILLNGTTSFRHCQVDACSKAKRLLICPGIMDILPCQEESASTMILLPQPVGHKAHDSAVP